MARIAFIGAGTMGRGMIENLIGDGHQVTVWNRDASRSRALADRGAVPAPTTTEAITGADFVMICLADDAAVRAVVLADDGIAATADPASIVIDLSTISVQLSDVERAAFDARGVRFLDAPVFGSKGEAAAGGLWVVAGGEDAVFEAALPVLRAVAETVHHMGPGGSGARMKLTGNLVVASQLLALGEALTLASKAGLDLARVLEVFAVTDFRSPIFDGVGASVLQGDYSPSFALALMQKDVGLITDFAAEVGAPVSAVAAATTYIDAAVAAGWGEENASALIKAVAVEGGVQLPRG